MKSKLIISIMILALAITGVLGATAAYFSDTGTSNGNTFTAGSLDLQVNGSDGNVTLFNLTNMNPACIVIPTSQPVSHFDITNTGSINGYLNIKSISVTNAENDCIGPEIAEGDVVGSTLGELGQFLNIHLYFDNDADGYWSVGDTEIFSGRMNTLPSTLLLNKVIPAGTTAPKVIAVVNDWWASSDSSDNLAQTDSVTVNMTFTLDQIAQ